MKKNKIEKKKLNIIIAVVSLGLIVGSFFVGFKVGWNNFGALHGIEENGEIYGVYSRSYYNSKNEYVTDFVVLRRNGSCRVNVNIYNTNAYFDYLRDTIGSGGGGRSSAHIGGIYYSYQLDGVDFSEVSDEGYCSFSVNDDGEVEILTALYEREMCGQRDENGERIYDEKVSKCDPEWEIFGFPSRLVFDDNGGKKIIESTKKSTMATYKKDSKTITIGAASYYLTDYSY